MCIRALLAARGRCLFTCAGLLLSGVVGAGDLLFTASFDEPPEGPYNDYEAARFLTQASFGPTRAEITRLRGIGYNAWLNEQLALPFSGHQAYLDQIAAIPEDVYHNIRYEAFMQRAMSAPDQLRQRLALALSEIFVVSDQSGAINGEPFALAHYYDLLGTNAFGNYRSLLEKITLDPVMGHYLSMFRNQKPDPANNVRPDENYAREIMQLFSIGLVELNSDGSVIDDDLVAPGIQSIPSYNQDTIRGFAHVFTGWAWFNCAANNFEFCGPGATGAGWFQPMAPNVEFHALEGDKQLLVYPGVALPGGVLMADPRPGATVQTVRDNLAAALDNVFGHPNVGPFIARRLIKRLVSSNPDPGFVARVASVFNNNGSNVRGDLGAVVRAILLDPDARARPVAGSSKGKLREPLLRWTEVWRALSAQDPNGRFNDWYVWYPYASVQAPLHANSVFNFFLPDYANPGADVAQAGLVSPEFQIETDTYLTRFTNLLDGFVTWQYTGNTSQFLDPDITLVNIERERALSANVDQLLEHLDVLFMGGTMSPFMRDTLRNHLNGIPVGAGNGYRRVTDALSLILVSPEFAIEK